MKSTGGKMPREGKSKRISSQQNAPKKTRREKRKQREISTIQKENPVNPVLPERENQSRDPWKAVCDIDQPIGDDSSLTTRSTRGKKRARVGSGSAQATQVLDDTTASRRDKAFLFTARVDVAILNANWGTGHGANRYLRHDHVADLRQSFQDTRIRRVAPEHRLKASITATTFEKVITSVTSDTTKLAMFESGKVAMSADKILFLDWDSSWPRPTLDAGQHRRAALLTLLGSTPHIKQSPIEILDVSINAI